MDPAGETEALFRSMEQAMQPVSAAPATADGGAGHGAGWGQAAMQAQQQHLPPGLEAGPAGGQPVEEPRRGRRRHKWGPIPGSEPPPAAAGDGAANGETQPPKRKRRSRWEDNTPAAPAAPAGGGSDDSKALMLMPSEVVLSNGYKVVLPPALTGRSPTGDPEVLELHKTLIDLNRKLQRGEVDIPPEGERSPSPPPKYNEFGIRLNTREIRYKEKMQKARNRTIEELIRKDPTFKPPPDYRPERKWAKIPIPQGQYPGYNFIGLIIGPRGNTQKRMQAETNTKIAIRGKGSVKEGASKDPKYDYGEDEELHVMITGEKQEDVDAAVALINRLLQPDDEEMNLHKQLQLRELAALNGTLKDETYCFICGESGHRQTECPKKAVDVYRLPDAVQAKVDEQYQRDLARTNPGDARAMDQEYRTFLAELGGGPLPPEPSSGGPRGPGGRPMRPGDELPDNCKLYVGNLSPAVDDALLRQMFEPFGTVLHTAVIKDQETGQPRGFGFVHMSDDKSAGMAREGLNGKMIDGRALMVRLRSEERAPRGPGGGRGLGMPRPEDSLPDDCKIYVGCLPEHVDDFQMQRQFEAFGPVVSTRVILDRETRRPKGFGFVNMADSVSAKAAIDALDGYTGWGGNRPLRVMQAGQNKGGGGGGDGDHRHHGGGGGYGGGHDRAPHIMRPQHAQQRPPPPGMGGPPPQPYPGAPPPPYAPYPGVPPMYAPYPGAPPPPYGAAPPPYGAPPPLYSYAPPPLQQYPGAPQQQPYGAPPLPPGQGQEPPLPPGEYGGEAPQPPLPPGGQPPLPPSGQPPMPPPPPAERVETEYERFMREMGQG